jgi:uncharacterized membrane protein
MSEPIFTLFLILHIAGGSIGLLTGMLVLSFAKGKKLHKALGMLFVMGMMTAGFSSLILAIMHPNPFLFMIGVFTLYMTGTGVRFIKSKLSNPTPATFDRVLQIGMGISGVILIGWGAKLLFSGSMFGVVLITFGGIGMTMLVFDLMKMGKPEPDKLAYIRIHLQRLLGAFIASFTAFLVVNLEYMPDLIPGWIYWILPTVIITPLISYWSRKYQKT